MSSIAHGVLLLVLGLADIAWGVRTLGLFREGARTGQPFLEVRNAVPTMVVGVLINLGLIVALTP